jgi:hypothetical protein
MSRYEYTDPAGDRLVVAPDRGPDGRPAVALTAISGTGSSVSVMVPLEHLEEAIAGQRDMARQAAYTVAYHQSARFPGDSPAMRAAALTGARPDRRRTLTDLEHDAAWHAIEGAADEDGADPGTVLVAVLRALGIAPLAAEALASTTTAPPPGCPAKHGAYGRVCELADGHTGAHRGSIPGGHVSWHGDADGWE